MFPVVFFIMLGVRAFFILCQNCKTGEKSSCGDKERAAVFSPKERQRLPPNARAVAEWPLVAYLNSTSSS